MRAFVTGGTGLLGRHLVRALRARQWEVVVLTRDAARARDLEAQSVHVVVGDITRPDYSAIMARSDAVFHMAGWFEVGVRDVRRMLDVNVTGTANVLAAAREAAIPRIVVTSTAGILAPETRRPITEASEPQETARDAYVVSKRKAHDLVVEAMRAGSPITMVAPGAVFGPGDTGQLGRSLALLVRGRLRTLPKGFGVNTWTHAADVAEAHILAATTGKAGQMYVVGDRVLPFYDFLRTAAEAAGVPAPRRFVPAGLARIAARFAEVRGRLTGRTPLLSRAALDVSALDVVVDATRARTELGWRPLPFEDRIRETMAWYVSTYGDRSVPLPIKPDGASVGDRRRRAPGPWGSGPP